MYEVYRKGGGGGGWGGGLVGISLRLKHLNPKPETLNPKPDPFLKPTEGDPKPPVSAKARRVHLASEGCRDATKTADWFLVGNGGMGYWDYYPKP